MTCGTIGASADNMTLIFLEESTFGTTPAGNPAFEKVRFTSESLNPVTGTQLSNEISGDRRVQDIIRSDFSAAGDVAFELSYQSAAVDTSESLDLLWEAGFQSADWTSRESVTASTISFQSIATAANGNSTAEIDDSGNGLGTFDLHSIIAVSGSTSNNFLCKVMAVAAGTLEVQVLNSTNDLTDEAAGDTVTIVQGNYITDGSECRAFTFEKEYTDLTTTFELYNGMVVNTYSLTVPTSGPITGNFGLLGKAVVTPSPTSTAGSGTPNEPEANRIMNSIDNVFTFTENNAEFDIVSFGLTGTNNLRGRQEVGTLGFVSVGSGRHELSGTLQANFANSTFFDKYTAFTETPVVLVAKDEAGNVYVWDVPALQMTAAQRVAGGINTDIIVDASWSASEAATEGYMIRMTRLDTSDVA